MKTHLRFNFALLAILVLPLGQRTAQAQDGSEFPKRSCSDPNFESVPSRPTVSNGADTTECGVLEVESGVERRLYGASSHQDTFGGGLRFGILPNLDFHWQSGAYTQLVDQSGVHSGSTENWVGLKYKLLEQKGHRPALGVFYFAKIPTDDPVDEFRSGRFDQTLSLIVSKDLSRFHFDFNAVPQLFGRPGHVGHDFNTGLALSGSVPLKYRFSAVAEGYGATYLNPPNAAFSSGTLAITYQVNRRLILDTGGDWGLTSTAPPHRFFFGLTYAAANLYGWMRRARR